MGEKSPIFCCKINKGKTMKSFRTFLENVKDFKSNLMAYQNDPATILQQRRQEAAERLNAIRERAAAAREEAARKTADRFAEQEKLLAQQAEDRARKKEEERKKREQERANRQSGTQEQD